MTKLKAFLIIVLLVFLGFGSGKLHGQVCSIDTLTADLPVGVCVDGSWRGGVQMAARVTPPVAFETCCSTGLLDGIPQRGWRKRLRLCVE